MSELGFEIKGRFYPFPKSFRICDPVLVTEVTGIDWPTFAERLDDDAYGEDAVQLAGLISVAFWQQHPNFRRQRVVRYLENLEMDKVQLVGGEDEEDEEEAEGADAGPPDQETEAGENTSSDSPTPSKGTPESPSEP